MPLHDWTRVDAGIYHAFHHAWITEISRVLNHGLLPQEIYALPEQSVGAFGPDVITLQGESETPPTSGTASTLTRTRPKTRHHAESADAFYRRKQNAIVIRHVSGDAILAMIEIVSPGNKHNNRHFRDFLQKAWALLDQKIHLVILDPFPPGKRDPQGVHAAIWDDADSQYRLPQDKPLTFASYECGEHIEAFVENLAVGDELPAMPLFLEPGGHISLPLEATYQAAWETIPRRWQKVIAP